MSRSGYSDDCENLELWRCAVNRSLNGKRGQNFLRDLIKALDVLPGKILIAKKLQDEFGSVCALGAVGKMRGLDMANLDPFDYVGLSSKFGIAHSMVQEIEYMNDEFWRWEYNAEGHVIPITPQERWTRMRKWAQENIQGSGAIAVEG